MTTQDSKLPGVAESGPADPTTEPAPISRRSLLVGSAGVTLGAIGLAAAGRAAAQGMDMHGTGGGGATLSQRAYPNVPTAGVIDIAHNPVDLPPPITRREPATVKVELETVELEARLDDRATFRYWTFNRTVPGPFVRVRVGDTVECTLKNHEDSWMMHNVDFHAVTGPGGGAALTTAAPGEQKGFKFKALNAGLYVYHCAVPPVAQHISNGMYGLILVEPEEGLPPVDREFYVMQGEIYTTESFGTPGLLTNDYEKLINERPEFFVLNGHVGALTEHYPMQAKVGETIRIFFGVGGPNYQSSFHVIGEIFDRVYIDGSLTTPARDVQTTNVPAGGAVMVEFKAEVPGRFVLVDHSLSRVERGLAGYLDIEGPENPQIYAALDLPKAG